MPRIATKKTFTKDDYKYLLLAVQELRDRGVEIPEEMQIAIKARQLEWPLAPNGYFIKNDGTLYNPSPVHEAFIKSKARNVLMFGPRGCGKSGSGSQKALFKIMNGQNGMILNPDFENLKISTWPEFREWIPWNMVVPVQRHRANPEWEPQRPFTMVFMNGVRVYLKGGKESGSGRGPNINWLWYDEGGRDETGQSWKVTNAGVRVGDNPQAWCTETPRTMEHWSYKFFIEQEIPPELLKEFEKINKGDRILVEYFHATREDNQKNLDPIYYAQLSLNYPAGWMRQQEYEGDFANEGGQIGSSAWFKEHILDVAPEKVITKVRAWDLAGTEKKLAKDDPDETVGALVSKFSLPDKKEPQFCIEHEVCGYWAEEKLMQAILNTARHDGPFIPVWIEQEPASSGKNFIEVIKQEFKKHPELQNHQVNGVPAKDIGDRVQAATTYWFGQAARGNMWILKGEWNSKFFSQLNGFTQAEHDDRITVITTAMYKLNPWKQWAKIAFQTLRS